MQSIFFNNHLKQVLLLALIFLLSFYLRWTYISNTSIIQPIRADAYQYVRIALNLEKHHVFSSDEISGKNPSRYETRPPGYPFFLAAIASITDSFSAFYRTTLLIQSAIGAMTVILTYMLTRFILPFRWSVAASFLVMLSPHMIATSAYILTECLFTWLLLLSMVILIFAYKADRLVYYFLAGVALGIGVFVRPVVGIFPLLCAFVILFLSNTKNRRKLILSLVIFLLTSYSFQFSWSAWRRTTGSFNHAMSSQLKTAFLCGAYPNITYKKLKGMPYREDSNFSQLMKKNYGEIIFYILDKVREKPFRYATWWLFEKPAMFWSWKVFFSDGINFYPILYSWFDLSPVMHVLRAIMLTLHPFLVFFSATGVFLFFKQFKETLKSSGTICYVLCLTLLIHFTLMFMVLAPFPRYALPMGPELYLMSMVALYRIAQMRNFRKEMQGIKGSNKMNKRQVLPGIRKK